METEQELTARYARSLAADLHTSPGLQVDVGHGQQAEVVHVVADPLSTLVFYRREGGPAEATTHYGIHPVPLDPPETTHGHRYGTRWQGFHVAELPPLLPFRRSITLGFGPALPGDATPEAVRDHVRGAQLAPPAILTVPVDPQRTLKALRTGPGGAVAEGDKVRIQALSVVSGIVCAQVTVLIDPPNYKLWGHMPDAGRPLRGHPGNAPASVRRRGLRPSPGRANVLPTGAPLYLHGSSGGATGVYTITMDAPLAAASGIALQIGNSYQWDPVGDIATVPAPDPQHDVDLTGNALTWSGGRLNLLAWEPGESQYTLVAEPDAGFNPPDWPQWPQWLAELRLQAGDAGVAMPLTPCEDGTFAFTVPKAAVEGARVRIGMRSVGRRLPAPELHLFFDR